jgi:hypothetical protein
MITLQNLLEIEPKVEWGVYKPLAQIGWLHAEQRDLISPDQKFPSSGLRTVIPTAIFTFGTDVWQEVSW